MNIIIKPITLLLILCFSSMSFAGFHSTVYFSSGYAAPIGYYSSGYPYEEVYYHPHYHVHEYYSSRPINHQDVGTLTGGIAGGLLGSTIGQGNGQLLAIAAGTIAGALIGGSIGRDMDDTDRMRMQKALEYNSVGEPAYWRNARSGIKYRVVPVKNVNVYGNRYCREYRTIANIAGKQQEMYGTACRQPDGNWKIVR